MNMTHLEGTDAATRISEDFHELAKSLHAGSDPNEIWQQLAELAAGAVSGCEGASVIKAPRAHRPAAVLAAASDAAVAFARAQCLAGEGPGIDAAAIGGMVTSNDLASDLRWPVLREYAGSTYPVRGVVSFRIAEQPCGLALSFSSSRADVFDSAALATAALVAAHAGTFALHQDSVRKVINLEQALETSRTIGAAIGIVMLARKLTLDQAFDALRETSQRMHVKIRDLAQLVTETGELPPHSAADQRPAMPPAPVPVG